MDAKDEGRRMKAEVDTDWAFATVEEWEEAADMKASDSFRAGFAARRCATGMLVANAVADTMDFPMGYAMAGTTNKSLQALAATAADGTGGLDGEEDIEPEFPLVEVDLHHMRRNDTWIRYARITDWSRCDKTHDCGTWILRLPDEPVLPDDPPPGTEESPGDPTSIDLDLIMGLRVHDMVGLLDDGDLGPEPASPPTAAPAYWPAVAAKLAAHLRLRVDEHVAERGYADRHPTRYEREDEELTTVLARILEGKEPHRAFGAPGDWGHDTPIGRILAGKE